MSHRTILRQFHVSYKPSELAITEGDRKLIAGLEEALAKVAESKLSGTLHVHKDYSDVCEHCGREWSNTSCEHNFGCCSKDRQTQNQIKEGSYVPHHSRSMRAIHD